MKALNKWLKAGNFFKKDEHHGFLDDQDEVTAVLEFHMHCPNCANEFKKSCEKSEGVESVEIDRVKGHARVKGAFDVEKLKERLWRKAKKVVTVVSVETHGKKSTQSSQSQKKESMCNEIVVKVQIHCEGCKDKVSKCLRGFDGVQDVEVDSANDKVIVRGEKVDPLKVLGTLKKKYSRNAELISPKFVKLENKETKEAEKKEDKAQIKVVVLKVKMHCQGCAHDIKSDLERMRGIVTVEPNMESSRVTVRGIVDPQKLVEYIKKRLGKHAEILHQETEQQNYWCKTDLVMWEYKWQSVPQSSPQCICLHHMFSDENPFSCSTV